MANRSIIYSLEQIRAFDTLWGWRDGLIAQAEQMQSLMGNGVTGGITGLLASQTTSPSLTINLGRGAVYQQAAVDSTLYGALSADATTVMQQGLTDALQKTFTTGGLTGGQSQWALVEVKFTQSNAIRVGDPNAGILPYINVAQPNNPFQGPNNSGVSQPTVRIGGVDVNIKYGTPASSSPVAPPPDAGYLPYLLILLTFGQTTISNGDILLAGDAAYSGYQAAPYFPGLIGQIPGANGGSHHGGIAGQANKINFTGGAEITGIAPLNNLPVTNTTVNPVAGIVTLPTEIPITQYVNDNPNGQLQGNRGDLAYNETNGVLFFCVVSGDDVTAQWSAVGSGGISSYKNANFSAIGGNFTYIADTSGGNLVATLAAVASFGGTGVNFVNIGTNNLTITPQAGESINGLPTGTSIVLLPGNGIFLTSRSGTGFYTLSPQLQYNVISTTTNALTVTGPSGSLYITTLTANGTALLPASGGGGKALTFTLDPASLDYQQVFNTTGSDTIRTGGIINASGEFFLNGWRGGVVTLTEIPGGWLAT